MQKKTIAALPLALFLCVSQAYAKSVIPSGECVGIKLYAEGAVVVDTAEITDTDGKTFDIASGYNIKKGDVITAVNGKKVTEISDISDCLKETSGEITLTVEDNGNTRDISVLPPQTADGRRLGLWLRDSTAGLGTITYIDENRFAALGHGICDVDTGNIMPINHGIIQECTVTSATKGKSGEPGALSGNIDGRKIGSISQNTELGLFGELSSTPQNTHAPVELLSVSEVKTGAASILADVDGSGVCEYSIEIKKIYPAAASSKDMIIKITDRRLIEKTGGIIQGMSGAPILQNGALAGAVTHVFVNDPTGGYGILAEHMLNAR